MTSFIEMPVRAETSEAAVSRVRATVEAQDASEEVAVIAVTPYLWTASDITRLINSTGNPWWAEDAESVWCVRVAVFQDSEDQAMETVHQVLSEYRNGLSKILPIAPAMQYEWQSAFDRSEESILNSIHLAAEFMQAADEGLDLVERRCARPAICKSSLDLADQVRRRSSVIIDRVSAS